MALRFPRKRMPNDFSVRLMFDSANRRGIFLTNGLRTATATPHELAFSWVYTSKVLELDECVTFTLDKCPPRSYFYFGVTRNLPIDDHILDTFSIFGPWSWSMEINGVYQTLYKHGCHYIDLRCNSQPPEVGNRYSIRRRLGGLLRFAVNGCDRGFAFNNVPDDVHVALMLTSGMKVTLN